MRPLFATLLLFSSLGAASAPPPLNDDLRARSVAALRDRAKQNPASFELAWAENWDHAGVAVLMAHPTANSPRSIPIAVLGERLLTPYDPAAFETIVRARFAAPQPAHAAALAQLALWFGDFGQRVGQRLDEIPVSIQKGKMWPRPSAAVAFAKNGEEVTLSFYAMDHELSRAYDCRVILTPGAVRLRATQVR